ncbi:G-type lectin S-receptor-like serine/threonine-protein kinase At5g24080 isoform X1 [Arabidopsis lyrata subsp. lyrata]|uniref:G-type lectin S-receptor-like serine/threonine-protein kinase At5g24080 isoform X1 n=1 Tax=Arabidopsis lyrata subsp. lyrata TaxID=81972 RepID=UPI000A29BCF9|nr:G-type lectin S-receptor-like serine/threonine-protein kinase At5g24080 isoform X1 [Arabidopsis lyrata subsp. lyrata]|eukprot:XP_020879597.1 G-type lectin S-receptor-like serine/threonine-protein kinase At5g24080 isoform X1 [Arabidopsis lyrata subsp. lyrata]
MKAETFSLQKCIEKHILTKLSLLFFFLSSFLFSSEEQQPQKHIMIMMMKFYTFTFLICLFSKLQGHCKSDISLGNSLTLTSPLEYTPGFMGKAYIMETESSSTREPGFKAALTMESSDKDDGRYLCSLQIFLGDVRVWSSGHYSKMYVSSKCIIELTKDGDLRLKSSNKHVGWRSGTSGQGVERLEIQSTGNLVLVDAKNLIKWQSFNFPTDVMLSGQKLDVATQLTSFPNDSTLFYSFEILRDKIALFLNLNKLKYSYWEYEPIEKNTTVNFVRLGLKGLDLFDDNSHIIGRIEQPLIRFLALGNRTGNLGLYSYKPEKGKFEATFQAVVSNGDCSSINVEEAVSVKRLCDHEMVELKGVTTVLRNGTQVRNISKERCEELCKKDCECGAASYSVSDESCVMYGIVMGVKQIERVSGLSYMVKIPKGVRLSDEKPNVRKWVVGLVGGIDGFVILLLLSGFAIYFIRKRRKSLSLPPPPPLPQQPANTDS